ncbi:MAG: 3-phosphoshikimate 1-carboxyvinyltransferase [Aquificae bacterium]|nr:3-phosphoshikimate 1-carboxyvinyltransferase [Aquificota bacterium]
MKKVEKIKAVRGQLRVPSDKSITHRAFILGALAEGETLVKKPLLSEDTRATLEILKELGTEVRLSEEEVVIKGRNFLFSEPRNVLDAKNSGTTARIMMGVLATQPFFSVLTGDESLRERPMLRVVEPLREMGAKIDGREEGNRLPVALRGGRLRAISHFNKRSSAQVKSALLLAGLRAEGITEVAEPVLSRDHTERMLRLFGADLITIPAEEGHIVKIRGGQTLTASEVYCPADPSSAAYFVALGLLAPEGEIRLKEVLLNPTRDGFYRKVVEMGGELSFENYSELSNEPRADVLVRPASRLRAVKVHPEEVPSLIDELPILAVLMALAEGVSEVRGAKELRYKESDRIRTIVDNLRRLGVEVEEYEDGFAVKGTGKLRGGLIETRGDHRIAMAFTIAGLVTDEEVIIDNPQCVSVSYPTFWEDLAKVAVF